MVTFVVGGSGSGKSEYAEGIIMGGKSPNRYYIATMQAFDDEAFAKIERHRKMRAHKGFETIECQKDLPGAPVTPGSDVLLECISNLVANEMFDPAGAGKNTVSSIMEGIDRLLDLTDNLVIVSNNVFGDGDDYSAETLDYIKTIAEVNGRIADISDQVFEVVCGIPVKIK
jgi:adenosylcobinamide kinase/adenosylcobinamide-phosphate guanylyltransferase